MKKILSFITTILLLWAILMAFDYFRGYTREGNFLINTDTKVTDEYTKISGLGYAAKYYNYDRRNVKNGQSLKEFSIFGIVVSKEVAVVEE